MTSGNVVFAIVRLQALLGNFNYGKRGILDLTHTRLYTFASLGRLFEQCSFDVEQLAGIPAPLPKVFGLNRVSRTLLRTECTADPTLERIVRISDFPGRYAETVGGRPAGRVDGPGRARSIGARLLMVDQRPAPGGWAFIPPAAAGPSSVWPLPLGHPRRRVFAVHDVQDYFYPYHVLPARLILAEGHLPLWNPYTFAGIPLFGDGQTAMLYPANWLFLLLSGGAALNYVVLLQFSLAGVGTYLFARALGLWRLPAFSAAVAYMFCGFLTARVVHLSIMSGAAMIPLIFFCSIGYWRQAVRQSSTQERLRAPVRNRSAPDSIAAGSRPRRSRWRSRHLPGTRSSPSTRHWPSACHVIVRSVEQCGPGWRWRRLVRGPVLLAASYLVGYALAAVQLVPWIELARLSIRAAGPSFAFVFSTSTGGAEWLLFMFPYLLGAHASSLFAAGPFSLQQASRAWEHSGYVGVLPLALAVVGVGHFAGLTVRRQSATGAEEDGAPCSVLRHRWYSLAFLLLLVVAGVLLAAGRHTPVSHVMFATPVLGSLRAVERALVLAAFALTMLAGFGLQRIVEQPRRHAWLLVPAASIVGMPAVFVWHANQPDLKPLFGIPVQDLENLSLDLPNAYVPLLLALGSGLLLAWWSRRPAGSVTQGLALALVVVDMAIYTTSFTPTASFDIYRYQPEVLRALRSDAEPFRKATVIVHTNDLPNRVAQDTLALSWGMVHGIEDVNGFNSLQPRRYTDYLFGPQAADVSYGYLSNPALLEPDNPVLASLNVRYLLVPADTDVNPGPHLRPVFTNTNVKVYENTLVYPRAYLADQVRGEINPRAVLQIVTRSGFDGRRTALVESNQPPVLPVPTGPGSATVGRAGANDLQVATMTAEPRFLVVSEMYFPGWRAYPGRRRDDDLSNQLPVPRRHRPCGSAHCDVRVPTVLCHRRVVRHRNRDHRPGPAAVRQTCPTGADGRLHRVRALNLARDDETGGRSSLGGGLDVHRRRPARQRHVRCGGDEEADEPRVVVERFEHRDDEPAPRQGAADHGRRNRAPVPAAIDPVGEIEILELQLAPPHDPVVGDQHAGDRAQAARVAEQPGEDVAGRIGEQPPRLNHDAEDAGDQPAGLEADILRKRVGEIVGRRHDVGGDVDRQRRDHDGEHRDRDDDRRA